MSERRLRSLWTEVGGIRVHARVGGDPQIETPVMVLIHGLSISSRYMVPLAVELAGSHPVYAIDLPGFGRSGKPARVLNVPGMADAMVAWMDAVGLECATLLGNSLGSQVAVNVAARYPGRVEGMVLTGLALGGLNRNLFEQLPRAVIDIPREPLGLWPLQARDFVAAGPRRVVATLWAALHDPMASRLHQIDTPALVVHGTADPIGDRSWIAEVAHTLPRGRFATVVGGTHALPFSKPRELAELVEAFLADVEIGYEKGGVPGG